MQLEPLAPIHHAEAAELAASRVASLRRSVPTLPRGWADPAPYASQLQRLQVGGSGIAAFDGRRFVGYMAAFETDWGRGPLAWTPEWAWGVRGFERADVDRREAIADLYAAAAERWVATGARTHWISVLADDAAAIAALESIGFGHHVVDGLRDLSPLAPRAGARVRRAEASEVGLLAELEDGLRAHLTASPIFLPLPQPRSAAEQRRRITDPERAVLFAEVAGEVVGHLLAGPVADDVALVVRDLGTASITGAYVRPAHRRRGVAESLLAAGIDWARERGYERIGVDFESANLLARRFWLHHFQPVTRTLVRRLPA